MVLIHILFLETVNKEQTECAAGAKIVCKQGEVNDTEMALKAKNQKSYTRLILSRSGRG